MPLANYAENKLLCNVSVNGATSTSGIFAFRGDMIIIEGEVADAQGRRHPPKAVLKQAVVLATGEKLTNLAGAVDDIGYLPGFVEKYGSDFAEDIRLVFYVSNIGRPLYTEIKGFSCILIPQDGAVWTMLMDDLRLEKSDFKGQSAEDKVITMFEDLSGFKPKYETFGYNEALSFTVQSKKEARGPV
ncbi:hypothetical protein SAMN02745866_01795 [Alteromonadaceae bacterium Bs31]|nr:hypothetical protein SAMN02745866_01795 [Alteromonadaceae bacterium Bs31]